MIDCQKTYRRGVMQLDGAEDAFVKNPPSSFFQTDLGAQQAATLAGISDLFAVVAGTPDDIPG